MNAERFTRKNRCSICSRVFSNTEKTNKKPCDEYLLQFLIELQEKLDDQNKIDEHFHDSIFDDEDDINQTSCTGLTLMHVNVLGGRGDSSVNASEEENNTFNPLYEESVAFEICQVLLKRGASPNGNVIYAMRPLHVAIRRQWMDVSRILLEAGANPSIPEKDLYASRPMNIAVINDDPDMIELLHLYGASLNGFKTMFHLPPVADAFVRGYYDVFKTLLELGAKPILNLERNTLRSMNTQLFDVGPKGRRRFIQLLHDHGGNVESEFQFHPMRVEPDGIIVHEPIVKFTCTVFCIADTDPSIIQKWICISRSLKESCRLTLRRYCFNSFDDGFKRLLSLKCRSQLNAQLHNYIIFNRKNKFFSSC